VTVEEELDLNRQIKIKGNQQEVIYLLQKK
jgi:hypothetical protein